jgi:hypothetical protein
MDSGKNIIVVPDGPDAVDCLEQQLSDVLKATVSFVRTKASSLTLLEFERASWQLVMSIGQLLVALFLAIRREQVTIAPEAGTRVKARFARRQIKSLYGPVSYGRAYLLRTGAGWFPLDAALGVTRDGFSWRVTELATRLATRVSYEAVHELMTDFIGWSPSQAAIERLALGLGSQAAAFLQTQTLLPDDGEVLVIEIDGKSAPFATQQELQARRRKRKHPACACGCRRHARRRLQRLKGPKPRKTRGHNSKNGRSATLAAMYTLQRGADGKLHGPINKKIWGRFGPRKEMMQWVRDQAARRGFGPDSEKTVQILMDGERCLRKDLKSLFPTATFTLDLRHAQERLWKAGRQFHKDGSPELAAWVKPLNRLLIGGKIAALLRRLKTLREFVSRHGPGTKSKRDTLAEQINFISARQDMMCYREFRKQDLVLATGVIEGACRHILGDRLDCSGMRWTPAGAEAVLQLRCIDFNRDWGRFIDWVAQECTLQLHLGKLPKIRKTPYVPTKQAA